LAGSPPSARGRGEEARPLTGWALPGRLNEFAVIFVSIVLQSLPFVLIGVFASAFVQQHLSEQTVARWLPRRRLPLVLLSSVFGFVAPVCDCGVIPLARRLSAKGVPVYAATTFILAAPVVNPVVLLSTAFAFQGNWTIVGLRMAMTLSVSIVVGLAASALFPDAPSLMPAGAPIRGGSLDGSAAAEAAGVGGLVSHATAEFFDVIFFIILGALFTAATQTLVPRGDLTSIGAHPTLSVLSLMPVATLLSICSEADAFVARAFAATFSVGAVLAFMTIGQIVDLRNGFLLFRTLGARLTALIVAVSYALVFVEGVLVNLARLGS
jgi:uncharacterized membrane protein YraQ (UPF0718 family)